MTRMKCTTNLYLIIWKIVCLIFFNKRAKKANTDLDSDNLSRSFIFRNGTIDDTYLECLQIRTLHWEFFTKEINTYDKNQRFPTSAHLVNKVMMVLTICY